MCTIVVLRGLCPDFPLVLATNRDEFYARPSTGARLLLEAPRTVGGSDRVGGGTWMGVSEAGSFVAVTNQRALGTPDRTKRSRGEIVLEALRLADPDAVRGWVGTLDARRYNGFNLLFGDASRLWVAYGRPSAAQVEVEAVPDGLHVLPNDRLDCPDFFKVERARAVLGPHLRDGFAELLPVLLRTLADTALPPLEKLPDPPPGALFDKPTLQRLAALCVRTAEYGTRSSTVVALRPGAVGHYLYADGPPDRTEFADVTGWFRGESAS